MQHQREVSEMPLKLTSIPTLPFPLKTSFRGGEKSLGIGVTDMSDWLVYGIL